MALASRQNNQRFSAPLLKKPTSGGVIVQTGTWTWNDYARDMQFVSKDGDSITCRGLKKKPTTVRYPPCKPSQVVNGDVEEQSGVNNERDVSSKQSGLRSSGGKNSHKANSNPEQQPLVTLSDVKMVAIELLDAKKIRKMSKQSAALFDSYFFKTEKGDTFLWDTIVYIKRYLVIKELESDKNLKMPGGIGRRVRDAMKKAKYSLSIAINRLAQSYSMLILAIGLDDQHHSMRGRLKASRSKLDLELFEAIYEFAFYVTWVTFYKAHWELIREELGRIFRTDAFKSLCLQLEAVSSSHRIHTTNTTRSEVCDTSTVQNGDITITEEEELNLFPFLGPKQERQPSIRSNKSIKLPSVTTGIKFGRPKRPPVGSLGNLRSPIIVSLLPDALECGSVLFVPPCAIDSDSTDKQIGIIGKPFQILIQLVSLS